MVSIEHLQRVWHADRGRLLLRTPGPVPFGICKCSFVETTETPSYITPPIHDPFPELTSYRIWHLSLIWPCGFSDPDVVKELSRLHVNFVIVPADKASNNYTFVCKRYYVDILIEELGLHLLPGNPTYNLKDFSASDVFDNHKSVLTSFGIQTTDEELDLPYIYWIPKMHKNPYKHRFIAGSSKCSTKPLSILLTKLLTHIKQGLQKYWETSYTRSGVNQMWILKNSKELLEHLQSPNFNHITSIKSFDFSTLNTTIPHQKLKSRLAAIIRNSFIHKKWESQIQRSTVLYLIILPELWPPVEFVWAAVNLQFSYKYIQ